MFMKDDSMPPIDQRKTALRRADMELEEADEMVCSQYLVPANF